MKELAYILKNAEQTLGNTKLIGANLNIIEKLQNQIFIIWLWIIILSGFVAIAFLGVVL